MRVGASTLLVAIAIAAGCQRGTVASTHPTPTPVVEAEPPRDPPPERAVADPPIPDHPAGECRVDADCAMLPPITWCGECPPAPPFEVGTRAELDALLIEAEQQCASEPARGAAACPSVPAGCTARAACVDTRCAAVAQGC